MDSILQQITDWLKEMLVSAIMGNLSGMFESVNNQVGEIATSVGMTPANFSPGVFAMVRNISESVIIPIAGLILTFIACYELIQMIIDHNNLANFETWMPANLNRKQQREIKAVVERAKKDNGIPQTAQQSIPFQRMFPDGICRVTDSYYTKTIQFQDINYQLAQQEDKTAIFDEWCSFLNFFDSSIHFELSFMNLSTDAESFEKSIRIPFKKDSFNPVRAEYSQMLKKQLAQGNNGLTKTKYLTFGIEAESMRQAKPRLNHIENDLLNNFRRLGVIATTMNGKERLHLMHSMFHMGDNDKFFFDWKYLCLLYTSDAADEL